jgi:DNA-binding GntR family transcriptional regulator
MPLSGGGHVKDAFDVIASRRAPTFREAAYASVKQAILSGQVEAGEPLVEGRIADTLGISRTPVREALALLEHDGLIAPRPGKGLLVRELTREEFIDMFVANELVEPLLARRAALHATSEHLQHLAAAIDLGERSAVAIDIHGSLQSGREFHRWLGLAANNPPLARFVLRNEEQTDLYLLSLGNRNLLTPEEMAISNREHQDILDAVRRRDPDAASRLVIYHAQSLRTRHAHIFRSATAPAPAVFPGEPATGR